MEEARECLYELLNSDADSNEILRQSQKLDKHINNFMKGEIE